jgi:hypothetical protein
LPAASERLASGPNWKTSIRDQIAIACFQAFWTAIRDDSLRFATCSLMRASSATALLSNWQSS